jgi:hypothetical protein
MRKAAMAMLVLAAVARPSPAFAWGTAGHRLIMARAIALLPPELKPFFEQHQNEIVIRVVDPDTWRTAGWEDDGNHFVNFGVPEYGKYPFADLPREYDRAIEKFGAATVKRDGTLPWREEEEFGNLRRAFAGLARGQAYAASNIVSFTAWMSHYIQDAYQPLHATDNYDGAQTGNSGIHARFETDLIERFQSKLALAPAAPKAIASPRDASFEALLSSYQLVPEVLRADNEAVAGKAEYDDDYFQKLFDRLKPLLERRLSEAITATAALIEGAWEQAGRPSLAQPSPRAPQRVRTPQR